MEEAEVTDRLCAVIAELDQARVALMADKERRLVLHQLLTTKADAEALLAELERDGSRAAAE